jgi:alpha-D-ribose 1-methylphosphonate 5-triphosphate synthase subunit PhnL
MPKNRGVLDVGGLAPHDQVLEIKLQQLGYVHQYLKHD